MTWRTLLRDVIFIDFPRPVDNPRSFRKRKLSRTLKIFRCFESPSTLLRIEVFPAAELQIMSGVYARARERTLEALAGRSRKMIKRESAFSGFRSPFPHHIIFLSHILSRFVTRLITDSGKFASDGRKLPRLRCSVNDTLSHCALMLLLSRLSEMKFPQQRRRKSAVRNYLELVINSILLERHPEGIKRI